MIRSALVLVAICFSTMGVGCQSMRAVGGWMRPGWLGPARPSVPQHDYVPVSRQSEVMSDLDNGLGQSVAGPDDVPIDDVQSEQAGFWSRLKAPSRFLMPRTDAWLGSEDADSSQDFDSGF